MNARTKFRARTPWSALLVLVLLLPSPASLVHAQSKTPLSPTSLAGGAIDAWEMQTGVAVDPRLTLEIAKIAQIFHLTYGHDLTSRPNVTSLLEDKNRTGAVVTAYLNDIVSSKTFSTRSLLDRFASEIGVRAHHAGYSNYQWNPYRHVALPPNLLPATLIASAALGGSRFAKKALILGYGNHLIAVAGKHYVISVFPQNNRPLVRFVPAERIPLDKGAGTFHAIPDPRFYCRIAPEEQENVNSRTGRVGRDRPANVAPFYQASAVSVGLSDQDGVCNLNCEKALSFVVVQAIAQWKAGCRRCGDVSLRALRVGKSIWLTSKLLRALSYELDTGSDSTNQLVEDPGALQQPSDDVQYGLQFPAGYHQVGDTAFADKLCAGDSRRLLGATISEWLCEPESYSCSSPSCIGFTLALGQQSADCDLGGNARYGCAVADRSIAINTDRYRFVAPVGTEVRTIFGFRGEMMELVDIRNLILHEVGHWFRLPHSSFSGTLPSGWGDVMALHADIESNLCITPASLRQIDLAINDAWKDQLPQKEGFEARDTHR